MSAFLLRSPQTDESVSPPYPAAAVATVVCSDFDDEEEEDGAGRDPSSLRRPSAPAVLAPTPTPSTITQRRRRKREELRDAYRAFASETSAHGFR